jgi:hypothetical protein
MPSAYADGMAVSTYADETRLRACGVNVARHPGAKLLNYPRPDAGRLLLNDG